MFRDCKKLELKQLEQAIRLYNPADLKEMAFLAIARDPIDRFLSGFLHLCIR
jgi:hypothetical protein